MSLPDLRTALRRQVLLADGATGSTLLSLLEEETGETGFPGGCPDALSLSDPATVRRLHQAYLGAGSDIILTNTFGACPFILEEYALGDRAEEINEASAKLAVEEVAKAGCGWAMGSLGPGSLLPSLGHVTFRALRSAYLVQARGLLKGGVHGLLVETCQDPLQAKAAISAIRELVPIPGKGPLVVLSLTVQENGKMLLGTSLDAALTTLLPFRPDLIGLNCGSGPDVLAPWLVRLADISPAPLWFKPNAGIPIKDGSKTVFPMGPDEFAAHVLPLVDQVSLAVIGGCCGTNPAHIGRLRQGISSREPKASEVTWVPSLSSLYNRTRYDQEDSPLLIGERGNVNGSRRFKRIIERGDMETAVSIIAEQAGQGAHAVDVCVDLLGRDPEEELVSLITQLRGRCTAPIFLDSATPAALIRAAEELPGRGVLNSVTFADGEESFRSVAHACLETGCAMVALAVDEAGQALTTEHKVKIAHRADILRRELGLPEDALFFDALTFPIGTGQAELQDAGAATLRAVEVLAKELPLVPTILGVSNISHGLAPPVRKVLNSMMLKLAHERGLTAAIVHADQITPLYRIPETIRKQAERLLVHGAPREELVSFLALFEKEPSAKAATTKARPSDPLESLQELVINGDKAFVETTVDAALRLYPPEVVLQRGLLDGMMRVGELFRAGEMQIPFVLASAEVVRSGSEILGPKLPASHSGSRHRIVLATVEGDVHDIGKNLVGIILENNGFEVDDLGTRVPVVQAFKAAKEHGALAIGLSGLLVQSVEVMRQGLTRIAPMGPPYPVIVVGGAALSESYAAKELAPCYPGKLYYAPDAMHGLELIQRLSKGEQPKPPQSKTHAAVRSASIHSPKRCLNPPDPPFEGRRVEKHIPFEEILHFLNRKALFHRFWRIKTHESGEKELARLLRILKNVGLVGAGAWGYWKGSPKGSEHLELNDAEKGMPCLLHVGRQAAPPHRSMLDYVNPDGDVISLYMVTMGSAGLEAAESAREEGAFSEYFLIHGLVMALTEALAELFRRRIVTELGLGAKRGKVYAPGMPALPDLSIHEPIFKLLKPQEIGIHHTEAWALVPECSASGLVIHHPDAAYFRI